jgi:PIN domain
VVIVYIETNLLIGLALGQEPDAADLLDEAVRRPDLHLAIPSICLMEATATITSRVHEYVELRRRLLDEVTQLKRNLRSPAAKQLMDRLEDARLACNLHIDGIMADFRDVVRRIRSTARIVPLTKSGMKQAFSSIIVEAKQKDLILPDNLIIHCILRDARRHPAASKAFLSGNRLEFTRPAVMTALKAAGIDKYFTDAKNALGWYRSQPAP